VLGWKGRLGIKAGREKASLTFETAWVQKRNGLLPSDHSVWTRKDA
jgi:hypothetical protein